VIPHNRPSVDEGELEAVARAMRSGHIAQGPEVRAFEEELASRFGRKGWDAVAVSSGTAALYLSLRALGIGRGDRVLIPTYVCTALVHATRLTGAEPALGDVRDADFNLDPTRVSAVSSLRAVILPHTYGVPSDPLPFRNLRVPLIEDAAQAAGARFGEEPVGSLGDLAVLSFYATKPLTCGQGGAVLGPKEACDAIRDIRDYDGKRELQLRFNFQMTDMQAALGRTQLGRLDEFLARRRETSALYASALPASIGRQEGLPGSEPNGFRFVIRLKEVERARALFEAAGITTIVPTESWELLHRQMGLKGEDYPQAEAIAETTLSMPVYPSLKEEERRLVASVIEGLEEL